MSRFSTLPFPIFPMKTAAAVAVVQRSHRKLVAAAAAALSEREDERETEEGGSQRGGRRTKRFVSTHNYPVAVIIQGGEGEGGGYRGRN